MLSCRRQIRLDKLTQRAGGPGAAGGGCCASEPAHGERSAAQQAADSATAGAGGACPGYPAVPALESLSWRLDKDEASSTFNLMRSNLLALMAPQGPAVRLRQLVVDLDPPQQGQLIGTAAVSGALHCSALGPTNGGMEVKGGSPFRSVGWL